MPLNKSVDSNCHFLCGNFWESNSTLEKTAVWKQKSNNNRRTPLLISHCSLATWKYYPSLYPAHNKDRIVTWECFSADRVESFIFLHGKCPQWLFVSSFAFNFQHPIFIFFIKAFIEFHIHVFKMHYFSLSHQLLSAPINDFFLPNIISMGPQISLA